jgi:DNA-directed RNA polymerase subunit M/transcription elongation factor TFIIS
MVVIFSVLGITINPIILFFDFIVIILMIIGNIIYKHKNRNNWIMKCSRCGHQFTIINPDKVDIINKQNEGKKENQRQKSEKKTIEALTQNGKLEVDEILLNTVDYFTPRKYLYVSGWHLKVTNKALICFNDKSTFRIYKKNIEYIKKIRYASAMPAGIQICIIENGKNKKYDFVVQVYQQREIVDMLNKWKQSQQ